MSDNHVTDVVSYRQCSFFEYIQIKIPFVNTKRMKTILTSAFILIATASFAQVHFSIGAGAADKGPIASLNVGYTANGTVMIEYDQRIVVDRKNPGYFGARVGYVASYNESSQFTILAGGHYRYFQAHSSSNAMVLGAGVQYRYYPPKMAVNSYVAGELYYLPGMVSVGVVVGLDL